MGSSPRPKAAIARRLTPWAAIACAAALALLLAWTQNAPAQADAEEVRRIVQEIRVAFAKSEMVEVKSLVEELRRIDPQHPNLPLYSQMVRFDPNKARSGPFALPAPPRQHTATPRPSPTATPQPTATPPPARAVALPKESDSASLPMMILGMLLALAPIAIVILLVKRAAQQNTVSEPERATEAPEHPEPIHEMHPQPESPGQPGGVPLPNTESPVDYEPTPRPPDRHMASAPPSEPSFEAFEPMDENEPKTTDSSLPQEPVQEDEEPLVLFEEETETPLATEQPAADVRASEAAPMARPDERPPRQIMPEKQEAHPVSPHSQKLEQANPPLEPKTDEEALDLSDEIGENSPPRPTAERPRGRTARNVFPESPGSPFLTDEDTHDHLERSTSPFHSDEETVLHVPERHDAPDPEPASTEDPTPTVDDQPRFSFSGDEETQITHLPDSASNDETQEKNG